MGGYSFAGAVILLLGTGACSRAEPAQNRADGVLQLELGGPHSSLRATLLAAHVAVEAPRHLLPESPAADESSPTELPPSPAPEPVGDSPVAAPPVTAVEPDWFVVTLGPKQTLMHLAKQHLGNGNRYRELMTVNGWSDDDVRRLPTGQQVKIPRVAGARPR